jgi:hypothetical protein
LSFRAATCGRSSRQANPADEVAMEIMIAGLTLVLSAVNRLAASLQERK